MATPLYDAMTRYIETQTVSYHTPGHKGQASLLAPLAHTAYDLTEIPAVGSLYDGDDVIEQAERETAAVFGAKETFFSGGGCTLAIQTMLALAVKRGGRVLMGRNAHRSAVHAAALLGADVVWLLTLDPDAVEEQLSADETVRTVYVTSPDYYGRLADISRLSAVCRRHGAALLVDNAHGTHLGAFGLHPLTHGADATADSAHKTLPVLTGGAWLHVSPDGVFADLSRAEVKTTMALFGSTSPAFPVLASLDVAQDWWRREGRTAFLKLRERIEPLRQTVKALGWEFEEERIDPVRLTLDCKERDARQVAEFLRQNGAEAEYADRRYAVLLLSPFHTDDQLARLQELLVQAAREPQAEATASAFTAKMPDHLPETVCGLREALTAPHETVPLDEAVGRVSAQTVCPCPPGVAAIVPGERVEKALITQWAQDGMTCMMVLK